jgi:hypothetical protein
MKTTFRILFILAFAWTLGSWYLRVPLIENAAVKWASNYPRKEKIPDAEYMKVVMGLADTAKHSIPSPLIPAIVMFSAWISEIKINRKK